MSIDPTTEQAIRTVARRVIVNAVDEDAIAPEWENYPDLGEDDWELVIAEAQRFAGLTDVQTEHYEAAYRHLADRATEES